MMIEYSELVNKYEQEILTSLERFLRETTICSFDAIEMIQIKVNYVYFLYFVHHE